jgi:hypothetical protein
MNAQNLTNEEIETDSGVYEIGEQIGGGAEGNVYEVKDSELVLKKFDNPGKKQQKVSAMVKNKPDDPTYNQHGVRSIIWPDELARNPDTGAFLGYVMPYKDLSSVKSALEYAMTELSNSTPERRRESAKNLAIAVKAIHQEGHAIGDFNHENILIDDGFVILIDCDAFHITDGNATYSGSTYSKRYAPPEKRGTGEPDSVKEADKFCLGVHIFQFLLGGAHPFQAQSANGDWPSVIRSTPFPYLDGNSSVQPINNNQQQYDQLPKELREKFEDCFTETGKDLIYGRPDPTDWIDAINTVNNTQSNHSGGTSGSTVSTSSGSTQTGGQASNTTAGVSSGTQTGGQAGNTTTGASGGTQTPSRSPGSKHNSSASPSTTGSNPDPPKPDSSSDGIVSARTIDTVKKELKRTLFYVAILLMILTIALLVTVTM